MTHFYEKNIVEIKNEYTSFLINIITPLLYEGMKSIYIFSVETHGKFIEKGKFNSEIKSPGILKIFQTCLREVPSLNNQTIEEETIRIKNGSKCAEWFDDLIKAVIKSNIVLLTFTTTKNKSDIVNGKYHERIETKDFIHKCLIETARAIYNNPELFWHEYPTLEIKRNQRETCELIKQGVAEAIRKMLPMKLILQEYLKNDYLEDNRDITKKFTDSDYKNIANMIKRDLNRGGYNDNDNDYNNDYNDSKESDEEYDNNLLDQPDEDMYDNNNDNNNYDDHDNIIDDNQVKKELKELSAKATDIESVKKELKNIEDRLERDIDETNGYTTITETNNVNEYSDDGTVSQSNNHSINNESGEISENERSNDISHEKDSLDNNKNDNKNYNDENYNNEDYNNENYNQINNKQKGIPPVDNDPEIKKFIKNGGKIPNIEPKKKINKRINGYIKQAVDSIENRQGFNNNKKKDFFSQYKK